MKLVRTLVAQQGINAIDLLSQQVPELSKGRLKDAMAKGADRGIFLSDSQFDSLDVLSIAKVFASSLSGKPAAC